MRGSLFPNESLCHDCSLRREDQRIKAMDYAHIVRTNTDQLLVGHFEHACVGRVSIISVLHVHFLQTHPTRPLPVERVGCLPSKRGCSSFCSEVTGHRAWGRQVRPRADWVTSCETRQPLSH